MSASRRVNWSCVPVRLEARILEAMADRPAAQTLRWSAFEAMLDSGILREWATWAPHIPVCREFGYSVGR